MTTDQQAHGLSSPGGRVSLAITVLTVLVAGLVTAGHVGGARSVAPAPPPAQAQAQAQAQVIVIQGYVYAPPSISAGFGDQVQVENRAASPLSVTADDGSFDTGPIPTGATTTFTAPARAGTYAYHCAQLPFMTGQVVVG